MIGSEMGWNYGAVHILAVKHGRRTPILLSELSDSYHDIGPELVVTDIVPNFKDIRAENLGN